MTAMSAALADTNQHFSALREILLDQRFLGAGRVQAAIGSPRKVTPYNCFVSGTIPDSMSGIMERASQAAQTMRMGGGIGYDFSTLRPRGDRIRSLDSRSSGPVSFMGIFNAVCLCISSAGHRRGAQMGVLRVDHPDIEEFVAAKQNSTNLTGFNISVAVTDKFMQAVEAGTEFYLHFDGETYNAVDARTLWDKIMRATWDWAEPGVLFIDRINAMNNLYYTETLAASNPCGEQPLPPFGACLLGSFNLVKYVRKGQGTRFFDWEQFRQDIPVVVRAMDNVVDLAIYPLPEQKLEAKQKRRMGLGVTGLANALEAIGYEYASPGFLHETGRILAYLKNMAYQASALLAKEKGAFPLYEPEAYQAGKFIRTLDAGVQSLIDLYGIRNSHLTSIAPTGTISLCADNVSSGIEPVFAHSYWRTIQEFGGVRTELVEDYGLRVFGVKGKTADALSVDEHLSVLLTAQQHVDSAISKTCNVGSDVSWEDFKSIYMKAWKGGAKGCTTFRAAGKRYGVLNAAPQSEENVSACYLDPETGIKSCE
jgi:ribonucleoside-diphosphate reductase alpha chain